MKTTVEVVTPNDIDLGLTSQWHELQTGIGDTPFMSPEFAAAVDRVRGGVFVILVTKGDRLLAAWPLQRRHRFMAEPVGFGLSDFQGPVVAPGFRFDPAAVLRRARRFATYDFDHLIDPAGNFARWSSQARPSPFIDVDPELARFKMSLASRKSGLPRRLTYEHSRIARELGALTFEPDNRSQADLADLISGKRQQYRRTGRSDGLGESWRRDLLVELLVSRSPDCRGVMSALKADGRMVASHFGLRSRTTLNWWFPCYQQQHSRNSPGLLLMHDVLIHEAQAGTERIDLGTGPAEYKRRFATGAAMVFAGSAYGPPGMRTLRAGVRNLAGLAGESRPLRS